MIQGLQYIPEYISKELQTQLIASIDQSPWIANFKRRVQHYGYSYDYRKRQIDTSMYLGKLPIWGQHLAEQLVADGYVFIAPDQIIVNEYLPGQGITPHLDCGPCFGDTIVSLTLNSGCYLDFTHVDTRQRHSIYLKPRSLVVLRGEARYRWKHGIAGRKTDIYDGRTIQRGRRISLTMRKTVLAEAEPLLFAHYSQSA